MPKTIRPWLQLIRLPNVVTAAADSLAGWLLATGSLGEPWRWLPLVVSSMVLYASGTMLNDVFDFEIDRLERPGRPLPSGRVPETRRGMARRAGTLAGPVPGAGQRLDHERRAGGRCWLSAILGYNAGLKHTGSARFSWVPAAD